MLAADAPILRDLAHLVIPHARHQAMLDAASWRIGTCGTVPSIIAIVGPPGVGKSTLATCFSLELQQRLRQEVQPPDRIAVIRIEAPSRRNGRYPLGELWRRFLRAGQEILIDAKVDLPRPNAAGRRHLPYGATADGLERAALEMFDARNPRVVIIDEAERLGMSAGAEMQRDVLEQVQQLCDRRVALMLVGNYGIMDFPALKGQFARRMRIIHYARYSDGIDDQQEFQSALLALQTWLQERDALASKLDLLTQSDYIWTGSLGCWGNVMVWLHAALGHALFLDRKQMRIADLEAAAFNRQQLHDMRRDAAAGERDFEQLERDGAKTTLIRPGSVRRVDERAVPAKEPKPKRQRRPGQRNPSRDQVGENDDDKPGRVS